MGAPLHCYTCAGGGKSLENWGKAEEKWHCGVMVEAVNHCWLHPTSIFDVYKVFEHLHMPRMGISVHHYAVIPLQVGAKCWKIGVRRSTNHAEVSWVMLLTTADWISYPYWMYTNVFKLWKSLYAVDGHLGACLDCYTCAGSGQILENCGKVVPKWHCDQDWGCKPPLTASHIHMGCKKVCLRTFICCGWAYGCTHTQLYLCRLGKILENWVNVEPKWWCGVMVEASIHCWLHPPSILDVYNKF